MTSTQSSCCACYLILNKIPIKNVSPPPITGTILTGNAYVTVLVIGVGDVSL